MKTSGAVDLNSFMIVKIVLLFLHAVAGEPQNETCSLATPDKDGAVYELKTFKIQFWETLLSHVEC